MYTNGYDRRIIYGFEKSVPEDIEKLIIMLLGNLEKKTAEALDLKIRLSRVVKEPINFNNF